MLKKSDFYYGVVRGFMEGKDTPKTVLSALYKLYLMSLPESEQQNSLADLGDESEEKLEKGKAVRSSGKQRDGAKLHGVHYRKYRPVWTPEERKELADMVKKDPNISTAELAKHFNRSTSAIRNQLSAIGAKIAGRKPGPVATKNPRDSYFWTPDRLALLAALAKDGLAKAGTIDVEAISKFFKKTRGSISGQLTLLRRAGKIPASTRRRPNVPNKVPSPRKRYPEETREKVVECLKSGSTLRDAAKLCGVSKTYAHSVRVSLEQEQGKGLEGEAKANGWSPIPKFLEDGVQKRF